MLEFQRRLKSLMLFFIFFLLLSCNEKKETVLYKKPLNEKLDPTCTWLKKEENFQNPNFKTTFYNYYNKQIKEENYLQAAKVLEIVCLQYAYYFSFDADFFKTVRYFEKNYQGKIPSENSNFIYTYFGDYYSDKGKPALSIPYY